MATVKVLTTRQLNRALLARQMLLERSTLPIPRVLERMAGLQAQYAPAIYVGLWSRMASLERAQVTAGSGETPNRAGNDDAIDDPCGLGERLLATSWSPPTKRAGNGFPGSTEGPYSTADFAAAAETVRDLLASGPQPRSVLVDAVGQDLWAGVLSRHGPGAAVGDMGPPPG